MYMDKIQGTDRGVEDGSGDADNTEPQVAVAPARCVYMS